ncbi:MAG: ATP-binding protein, partial [Variovorax sp.]
RAALQQTGSYICERQLKRRNGELFWVEMGGSCIRPNDPDSGVIWTFLDITERKKSEAEIREALEQQKALNELRSRFVAMTSHEFRTPLAAIMSAEELLRHYGERLPKAERDEILDSIATGVQRMSRMMDRVLVLGKADAGMLDFQPQRIDVGKLCRQFVDEAHKLQPNGHSEVKLTIADDACEGSYDEKLLRHIFSNLLSNALKYSPGGGQVRFSVRRENGSTVFEVADQGIGIPPDEIPHLFESFHRASNVGAIQGTVWVLMDITERKELAEQLAKTTSEREAILNNALVGIVLSVNRRHEWVNEKFAQMLGYPRQVLIGQGSDYIHPDQDSWERFGEEARATLIATGSYSC